MGKCALIVDDSRTSRAVLQRILETHDLDVDHADSAESALDYLTEHRPDVIFMDHLMPGMDGFEAVSAIKRNPQTATIPIMMYTSQKGDVYVGQARALGAVGVLPKEVEPVEVSKILESLHIVGEAPREQPASDVVEDISSDEYPMLENLDQDMRLMLEDLFDQQRAILKRDILKSSDTIAAKVADQIKQTDDVEDMPDDAGPRLPVMAVIGLAAMAGIIVILFTMYVQQARELDDALADNATLLESLNSEQTRSAGTENTLLRQLDDYQQTIDANRASMLGAIAWGINRGGQYPFGEEPLGDARIPDFEALTARLQSIGFVGQVVVNTHVGEHCLTLGADGYGIADPRLMAGECDARGFDAQEALNLSGRQSVAMANFMNSAAVRSGGAISFVVVPRGSTEPSVQYPLNPLNTTAGAWNEVADMNNRIEIDLVPDTVTP